LIFVTNTLGSFRSGSGGGTSGGGGSSSTEEVTGTLSLTLPKTSFYYGEVFNTTGVQVIFTPEDEDPIDVTDEVLTSNGLTPGEGSTFNEPGQITVRASYTPPNSETVYATQIVTVSEPSQGYLTAKLSETEFVHGDTFNTSALSITYTGPDGTVKDLDPSDVDISISPSNGSTLSVDGKNVVSIEYHHTGPGIKEPNPVYLEIEVKPIPDYLTLRLKDSGVRVGHSVDYNGATINVVYTDRSERTIIFGTNPLDDAMITWDPLPGKIYDRNGTQTIKATYTENTKQAEGSTEVYVSNLILQRISVDTSNAKIKKYVEGDDFNVTGWIVTAEYDDGSTKIVTDQCSYDPDPGFDLTYNRETSGRVDVHITYIENGISAIAKTSVNVIQENQKPKFIKVTMTDTGFRVGHNVDYRTAKVKLYYDRGSVVDVTNLVEWDPLPGSKLDQAGDIRATATYRTVWADAHGNNEDITLTDDVTLKVNELHPVALTINLGKTYFTAGDRIVYDDIFARATVLYDDGSTRDVTDEVTWEPSSGTNLTTDITKVRAKYTENQITVKDTKDISVSNIPTKLEVSLSKTSYETGEYLDYTGSRIVVTYASGAEKEIGIDQVTWNPPAGTQVMRAGTQYITVSYEED
jgi:hypothetical protein